MAEKRNSLQSESAEWKADLRRLRAFWFGSRGFRPKLMRGEPILGWPESPKKRTAGKKSIKKSDRMAARY
ncbi:MAG TPA: hypothetical protein VKW78_06250 [Terriglobales bacterium]|nr:hypothetical protein [Terriglobales bacterium]